MPELTVPGITKIYTPTGDELNARKWVYKRLEEMKQSPDRQRALKVWELGKKAWEAHREPRSKDDWMTNYVPPLTTSIVESICAEVIDQQQRVLILPRGEEDQPKAMVMGHTFDYTWEVGDGDMTFNGIFKNGLIGGTAIGQEYYFQDKRMIKQILGLNKKRKGLPDMFATKEKEVMEFDDCFLEEVPLEDFFVDEKALDINRGSKKARDTARRYVMNIRDFKAFFKGPIWDPGNNASLVKPGGDVSYYQYYKPETTYTDEDVEVFFYYSRRPEDSMIIVANDVVIRMGPNIYAHKQLPFAKAVDINRGWSFYGKGEPELLDSIQDEMTTIRRMTIDRHHLDLDKSFLVGQSAMLDNNDLIAKPHNMIEVDDPDKIKPLEYGDIPASVQITLKAINEDAVRVTGVDDRFQSLQKTPSTATEAAILKESTLKRIKMKVIQMQKGFLTDVARMRVCNIMQFYSQPKLERIVGSAGTKEYKDKMIDLARRGMLATVDGEPFEKSYRKIRIEGKKLSRNIKGDVVESPADGFTFFQTDGDDYLPVHGGFDIRFEGGATLPISKPLLQSKASEMFDRLMTVVQVNPNSKYDPDKIADELVKVNDGNPDNYKKTEVVEQENLEGQRLEASVKLAGRENELVLVGQPILPQGTPYQPQAHTELHIAFLKSQAMITAPEEQYQKLLAHITGEMAMLEARSGQAGLSGAGEPALPQAGADQAQLPAGDQINQELSDTTGGRIQGGGQVPTGDAVNLTT